MGEILGFGGSMIELRRSKVHQFTEEQLVTMHEVADAYYTWKETEDGTKLKKRGKRLIRKKKYFN